MVCIVMKDIGGAAEGAKISLKTLIQSNCVHIIDKIIPGKYGVSDVNAVISKYVLGTAKLLSAKLWVKFSEYTALPFLQFCRASLYGIQYISVFFFAVLVIFSNIYALKLLFNRGKPSIAVGAFLPSIFKWSHRLLSPLVVGSHYGLFARMTKIRKEIIIEVSDDTIQWYPVVFAFKPTITTIPPIDVWPLFHMPRLDWRLWFLALIPNTVPRWFYTFLIGILEGNSSILGLLHLEMNGHLTKEGKACMYEHSGELLGEQTETDYSTETEEAKDNLSGGIDNYRVWKYIRVSIYTYNYAEITRRLNAAGGGAGGVAGVGAQENTGNTDHKQFWDATLIAEILPPTGLDDLYTIRDDVHHPDLFDSKTRKNDERDELEGEGNEGNKSMDDRDKKGGKAQPPKPDTAAELIARSLQKAFHTSKRKEKGN